LISLIAPLIVGSWETTTKVIGGRDPVETITEVVVVILVVLGLGRILIPYRFRAWHQALPPVRRVIIEIVALSVGMFVYYFFLNLSALLIKGMAGP